jgi:hypothetical protein
MMAARSLGCDLEQIPPGTEGDGARRREVSVIPKVVAEDDGAAEDPAPEGEFFLDPRVQGCVPIPVDQRLRERFRGWSGFGRVLAAHQKSEVVTG